MTNNINRQQQEKYELLWKNEWHDLHKIGPGVRTRNRILLRFFKKWVPGGSLFDSGCGDGSLLKLIHTHFKEKLVYHAGDISETAIKTVNTLNFISEASIIDIENPSSLPCRKFTVVVSSEVLEHIENWRSALHNLTNLVEENGYLFITVPAQMRYWSRHDDFAKHYHRFEPGEIELELKGAHFEIIKSWCWGWPVYWLYYSILLCNIDPQSVMNEIHSPIKKFASNILYVLFFIDDLFDTKNGRRMFIIAQK